MIASYLYHVVFVKLQSISYYFNNILSSNFKLDSFQLFSSYFYPALFHVVLIPLLFAQLQFESIRVNTILSHVAYIQVISTPYRIISFIVKSTPIPFDSPHLVSNPIQFLVILSRLPLRSPEFFSLSSRFVSYQIESPSFESYSIPCPLISCTIISLQFLVISTHILSRLLLFNSLSSY